MSVQYLSPSFGRDLHLPNCDKPNLRNASIPRVRWSLARWEILSNDFRNQAFLILKQRGGLPSPDGWWGCREHIGKQHTRSSAAFTSGCVFMALGPENCVKSSWTRKHKGCFLLSRCLSCTNMFVFQIEILSWLSWCSCEAQTWCC